MMMVALVNPYRVILVQIHMSGNSTGLLTDKGASKKLKERFSLVNKALFCQ